MEQHSSTNHSVTAHFLPWSEDTSLQTVP
uniref:Uncharacterized protein n=1 Tax=Anguilla anguilla TaxID=7936 RepID=A0A0E9QZD2_ANGAN